VNRQRRTRWTEARALICRNADEYLIVRTHDDPDGPWQFPGGRIGPRESAEEVLRRRCATDLGVNLHAMIAQPPFDYNFGTYQIAYRYFLCPVERDEAVPSGYRELRWVAQARLPDYVFDTPTLQVVAALLATPNGS
jgi:8-oxo-dGTP pyrophosphatase MutT (NUDIX family)